MTETRRNGRSPIGISLRSTAAALAVGGLAASFLVVGTADAASANKPKSLVISMATNPKLGTILVSGTTLYTLKTGGKTACGAKCLKVWPEVLLPKGVTKATAGTGVNAALLGTKKRSHGKLQVTYFGKPLYWFFLDKRPGQVKGNITDKWGSWNVVVTAQPAVVPATSATTTTKPAAGVTTTPMPTSRTTTPTSTPRTTPTNPAPTTTPPTTTPTTSPPATTTTAPPTTTTTSPGGGGIGF
jgi:predicted lipoprotein with Yx(FWY)xxD motif